MQGLYAGSLEFLPSDGDLTDLAPRGVEPGMNLSRRLTGMRRMVYIFIIGQVLR